MVDWYTYCVSLTMDQLFSILFFLISCISVYLFIKWRRVKSFWAERNVPHSAPNFIFGNLTFLQRENPFDWLIRHYNKYHPSPYFGIWLFWKPALVICNPELARNILVKDSENFRDRFVSSGRRTDIIGATNLFTVNDPFWTDVRRRLTNMFTAAKLKSLFPLKLKTAKDLVQRIRTDRNKNKRLDIRSLYADYTTDIIGAAAFSIAGEATLTGESPVRAVTKEFMKYSLWRGISWNCIFFLPWVVDIFRFKFFPKESTDFLTKIFNLVVEQRGGWQREQHDNKDLVDSLLKIRKEGLTDGKTITNEEIVAQVAVILQGGFDTTAVAMSFASYEMAYDQEIQDRLYQELNEAKKKLDGADFDFQTLVDLPYLNAVIKETLRKYPAMGWMDRMAHFDYKVDDKLTIPKGTPCYINTGGLHFDPQYYPDPTKYNPDRFLPENEKNIKPFTFMPFGEGPRNCIGLRFAYQVLRIGVAHLVLNFKMTPVAGEPGPKGVKTCPRGILMAPNRMLTVNFEDRN